MVYFISYYLTGGWYTPPVLTNNTPVANLNITFLQLFFQELFIVILLRFLRGEVDKRLIAQLTLIDELEERVSERTIDLEKANKELEAFSYSVSHDLRAPLRAIRGFSQALLDDFSESLDPNAVQYLQRMDVAAERMNKLINEILAFSRLGRKKLKREWIAPEEIHEKVIAEIKLSRDTSYVQFEIAPLPAHYVDSGMITQVYQNLLLNAVKYSRDRKPAIILIGWQESPNDGAYFVKDNGVGFDMAYVDKIFGAFQRLHSQQEFEGTGVGLATVQRIIQKHDGEI